MNSNQPAWHIALFHKKYVFDTCDFEQINVARRNEQSQQNGFFFIYWHIIYVYDKINKYFTKINHVFLFEIELYQTIVYARAFLNITLSYDYDIMIIKIMITITIMILWLDVWI